MSTLKESAQKIVDMYLPDEEKDWNTVNKSQKKWNTTHIVHDLRRLNHAIQSGELDGGS